MKENVLITINSTQTTDGEAESLETIYPGKHRSLPDSNVILYQEVLPDDTGNATSLNKNKMKIGEHSLILTKKGTIDTEMIFDPGKTHRGFYKTPYGVFAMAIHTSCLEIQKTNDNIHILIQYTLELNGMHVSDCTMNIMIQNATV